MSIPSLILSALTDAPPCVVCSVGVPDLVRCQCITFPSCEDYNTVVDQLLNITNAIDDAGETTKNITDTVKECNKDIDELTKYCQDNQDNLDLKYISDRITYIKTKLIALTLTVKNFTSTLVANTSCKGKVCQYNYVLKKSDCSCTCTLACATGFGEVKNTKFCNCTKYADSSVIYNISSEIGGLIKKVQNNVANAPKVYAFILELYSIQSSISAEKSKLESKVHTLNLTSESVIIKKLETTYLTLKNNIDKYLGSGAGACKTACKSTATQVKDCTCCTTAQCASFQKAITSFVSIESKILTYSKGNATQLAEFKKRTQVIRAQFQTLYETIYNNPGKYDTASIQKQYDAIVSAYTTLNTDFTNWLPVSVPSTPCKLACSATQIQDLKACACVTIIDWDKLTTVVEKGLPGLLTEINGLQIDAANKKTLIDNW